MTPREILGTLYPNCVGINKQSNLNTRTVTLGSAVHEILTQIVLTNHPHSHEPEPLRVSSTPHRDRGFDLSPLFLKSDLGPNGLGHSKVFFFLRFFKKSA